MKIVRYTICLITFVTFSFSGISGAASLEDYEKALNVISDFADKICNEIPLQGESENIELSGEAKAELRGLLKKLANLGIKGAGSYQKSEYQGVLREDLVEILKVNSECKQNIFKELKNIIKDLPPTNWKKQATPEIISYEINFRTKYLSKNKTVTLQPNSGTYPIYNRPGGCGPNDIARFSISDHILQTYIKDSCAGGGPGNQVNLKVAPLGATSRAVDYGYWVECKLIKKNYSE